jgi:hypothetical protein
VSAINIRPYRRPLIHLFFIRELLQPPKKHFFWFGTEPTAAQDLNHYLAKGKEAAHSTAAWASQTGTGLLFFTKHGEKKEAPTGVLNLVCVYKVHDFTKPLEF